MTRRQARYWFIAWVVSFFTVIGLAGFTLYHWRQPKPVAFVPPEIWREPYAPPDRTFSIQFRQPLPLWRA